MSVFRVKYWKKGKPTGSRSYTYYAQSTTFEEVLFGLMLNHICERNYYINYEWFMINEWVFVKRVQANGITCEYVVTLLVWQDRSRIAAEYIVEIEYLENDGTVNILDQKEDLEPMVTETPKKTKLPTDWYKNETRGVRFFLLWLNQEGSLKALKKSNWMSKATYYRNLKICTEKGYIKDGKLVKRLFVSKLEN
jgi:hypothetical protein